MCWCAVKQPVNQSINQSNASYWLSPVILICSSKVQFLDNLLHVRYHLHELPIVLLFGIATTINVVHKLLPHRVTSLLSMEKFQVPLSSEYLSLVLEQVTYSAMKFYMYNSI